MKLIISLVALTSLLAAGSAFARDYKKGEILKQEMGLMADTQNAAAQELMSGCLSLPFVEHGLAELIGITDIVYAPIHNQVMAYGACNIKIKMDLVESTIRP